MRRLYSTFAASCPGAGLLLLRLVVGSVLVVDGTSKLWSGPPWPATLVSASLSGFGLLLMAGLWTPLVGTAVAALEIWQGLASTQDPLVNLLSGAVGAALALLGPGRWSVDAQLFGWKRIELPPHRRERAQVRSPS